MTLKGKKAPYALRQKKRKGYERELEGINLVRGKKRKKKKPGIAVYGMTTR